MNPGFEKDLIVLTSDADMAQAVGSLLSRPGAFGVRAFTWDLYSHPQHDPGCLLRGHTFLTPYSRRYGNALVMLDLEGSGREGSGREFLEQEIESRLAASGWQDRARAIVIVPELEIWVWADSPHVAAILGWEGRQPTLDSWLRDRRFLNRGALKPERPKDAMLEALRAVRKPKSAAHFRDLAAKVGLRRCTDPAFLKFRTTLEAWYGRPCP